MGLALETGILSDLKTHDHEGFEMYRSEFEKVYKVLRNENVLTSYAEPENLKESEIWSCSMYGYSGIHYLRRLAAHLWDNQDIIIPGNEDSSEDEILERYSELYIEQLNDSFFSKLFRNNKRITFKYQHLILHSDCEGFYIPVDFEKVIIDDKYQLLGGMLGSTFRLKQELEEIASWLNLNLFQHIESEKVMELIENHGNGNAKWERFGIESYSCLCLYRACEESIKYNCAITFC